MHPACYLFIAVLLAFPLCSRRHGIDRGIEPEKGAAPAARVRCVSVKRDGVDLTVEPVDPRRWESLISHARFRKKRPRSSNSRMPRHHLFQVVVHNAGAAPVRVDSITFAYDGKRFSPVPQSEMIRSGSSPAFSAINLKTLVRPMRIMGDGRCIGKIRYDRDAVSYSLPFVSPGETVARIVPFPWMPVEHRACTITVTLAPVGTAGGKKVIDFRYRRYEYRTRGTAFIDPTTTAEEKGDED